MHSTSIPRRRPALTLSMALATSVALAGWLPGTAWATYQLSATARSHAVSFLPLPGGAETDPQSLNLLNQPGAATLQRLDTFADIANGGATSLFLGRIGLLKAYAAANFARCCVDGATVALGQADASVEGRFYDEVLVSGAGLATGTPVSYQLALRISGTVSSPAFESGGNLSANALAEARLRDLTSGQEASLSWDASRQATGLYTLRLSTVVGHTLSIQGMLSASALVNAGAVIGRSAVVDFYNSAGFDLAPSVAGLNTTGASGTSFLAPVPEPATAASLLAGLALLGGVLRRRRGA